MTSSLTTDSLELRLSPSDSSWSVAPRIGRGPQISHIRMSAAWTADGRKARWGGSMDSGEGPWSEARSTPQRETRALRMRVPLAQQGLEMELEWRAPAHVPLLLWRASMINQSDLAVEVEKIELFGIGHAGESATGRHRWAARKRTGEKTWDWGASAGNLAFYSNGWQSWSATGTFSAGDRFPRTRLGPLTQPMRVNQGTPHPHDLGHFSADFYGVLGSREARAGVLLGFLSQRQTFGTLETLLDCAEPALHLWANGDHARLEPGGRLETDWACLQFADLDVEDPLGPFLDAVAVENSARSGASVPVGWCSWYNFFQKVSQDDVDACLAWVADHRDEAPLSLIQIDDGFEAEVGDWFETNARFSGGLPDLQEKIRGAGLQPGLWLAPWVAKPGARILGEHPEWVLRGPNGRPSNAGLIWNSRTRALDPTHPGVIEHVGKLIRTARNEWGFDYLKLDFLYAGALPGIRHDPTTTRAQALYRGLTAIREAAGDGSFLVGCGCPLGSGIGIFDAMRISSDVAPRWKPAYLGIEAFFRSEPDFPSARNAIRNVLTRAHLHRRWWVNDPDCLLLREGSRGGAAGMKPATKESEQHLTEVEVQCLATAIALSAGSLLVSDDLPELGPERVAWLSRLIPPLPRAARVVDWFDSPFPSRLLLTLTGAAGEWCLLALINGKDRPQDFRMDLSSTGLVGTPPFHIVDFWRGEYRQVATRWLDMADVPPHGAVLLAARPVSRLPQWVGDTIHISQGLIVERWDVTGSHLVADLALGHRGRGTAFLALPAAPTEAFLDASTVAWSEAGDGVYAFDLSLVARSAFRVSWG